MKLPLPFFLFLYTLSAFANQYRRTVHDLFESVMFERRSVLFINVTELGKDPLASVHPSLEERLDMDVEKLNKLLGLIIEGDNHHCTDPTTDILAIFRLGQDEGVPFEDEGLGPGVHFTWEARVYSPLRVLFLEEECARHLLSQSTQERLAALNQRQGTDIRIISGKGVNFRSPCWT